MILDNREESNIFSNFLLCDLILLMDAV